jgi:hypothetical protein
MVFACDATVKRFCTTDQTAYGVLPVSAAKKPLRLQDRIHTTARPRKPERTVVSAAGFSFPDLVIAPWRAVFGYGRARLPAR